jgi:membrane-bound lytic murein transglycosylase D
MGVEKLIGYPLAFVTSVAVMSHGPELSAPTIESEGAGGRLQRHQDNETPRIFKASPTPSSQLSNSLVISRLKTEEGSRVSKCSNEALASTESSRFFADSINANFPSKGPAPQVSTDPVDGIADFIPAAPAWLKDLRRPEVAVPRNPQIAKFIHHFGVDAEGRAVFKTWLRRSGAYFRIATRAFESRGMPVDLVAVMFAESGCSPTAISRQGAVGLWQFMPQTAEAYGLTVRSDYDERRSVWQATDAAVTYLGDLYSLFHSWHLALAAYNLGHQRIVEQMQVTGAEDFFTLAKFPTAIPSETALYVPKVLAIAVILKNLEHFGFDDIELAEDLSASRVWVPAQTNLAIVARAAGTSVRRLRELNPQFMMDVVPDVENKVAVFIPNNGLARAKVMLPRLLDPDSNALDLSEFGRDFDWGRDDLDASGRTRLARTESRPLPAVQPAPAVIIPPPAQSPATLSPPVSSASPPTATSPAPAVIIPPSAQSPAALPPPAQTYPDSSDSDLITSRH